MRRLGVFALALTLAAPAPAPVALETRALPAPQRDGGPALASVLATRRSGRTFAPRALADRELSQLVWAAQGTTGGGHRTAPSAGALYPLTVRIVDDAGSWRYVPADHALVREAPAAARAALVTAAFTRDPLAHAPVTLVISAEIAITQRRYGSRAERYATLEAGHAAQNVLLTATALGLVAVPVGAFDDAGVRRALALRDAETPLYLIAVGAPP